MREYITKAIPSFISLLFAIGLQVSGIQSLSLAVSIWTVAILLALWPLADWLKKQTLKTLNRLVLIILASIIIILGNAFYFMRTTYLGAALTGNRVIPIEEFDKAHMETINCQGRVLANQKIILDGKIYKDCTFENVTFVYNGTAPFSLGAGNKKIGKTVLESDSGDINYLLGLIRDLGWMR